MGCGMRDVGCGMRYPGYNFRNCLTKLLPFELKIRAYTPGSISGKTNDPVPSRLSFCKTTLP
jgi:hypothetical protein